MKETGVNHRCTFVVFVLSAVPTVNSTVQYCKRKYCTVLHCKETRDTFVDSCCFSAVQYYGAVLCSTIQYSSTYLDAWYYDGPLEVLQFRNFTTTLILTVWLKYHVRTMLKLGTRDRRQTTLCEAVQNIQYCSVWILYGTVHNCIYYSTVLFAFPYNICVVLL